MSTRKVVLSERTARFVSVYDVGLHARDAHQFLQYFHQDKQSTYTANSFRADLIMSSDALKSLAACHVPLLGSDLQTPFLVRIYLAIPWQDRLLFTRIATQQDAHVVAQRFTQLSDYLKSPQTMHPTAYKEALEYTRALELASQHATDSAKKPMTSIDSVISALPKD